MITYYFRTLKDDTLHEYPESRTGVWVDVVAPTEVELDTLEKNFGLDRGILIDATDFYEVPRFEQSGSVVYFFTRYLLGKDNEQADTAPLLIAVGESFVLTLTAAPAPILEKIRSGERAVVTTQKAKFFLELMKDIADEYAKELTRIRRNVNRARTELRKVRTRNIELLVEYENALNEIVDALMPTNAWLSEVLGGNYLQLFREDVELIEDLTIATNQLVGTGTSILKAIQNIRTAHEAILTSNLNMTLRMLAALTILFTVPMTVASLYGMNVALPLGDDRYAFWFILGFIAVCMGIIWYYFSRKKWL